MWNHCLYKIHHHKRDKWINEDILLLEEWKLLELSKEGLDLPNEDVEEDSEEEKRKEKEQIWFIQKEFLEGEIGSRVTMPTISKSV